ncbi:MAG TPA: hypothetical protein VML75_23415, partial [Kofleriaceae bacterium]|nr:hypothetical protein [Kofleriaceae bacterium]
MSDVVSRIVERLGRYAEGVHRLNRPAPVVDVSLPRVLVELYRGFDGGELFHETMLVRPSVEVRRGEAKRWLMGELDGDELYVDDRGAVWRLEKDSAEWLEEGSGLERWLLGWVESQELLYDDEGEFREDVFDEDGEPTPAAEVARERRVLKRDRAAPAPRWRLARALARGGELEAARAELEQLLAARPLFAWGWFDMARFTERAGDLEAAYEDARAAAEAAPEYEHAPFFWAHAARLAALRGDERARSECAAAALDRAPELAGTHRNAAAQSLEDEDP